MKPKDKSFQALEDLWYKRLAKSGFEDIEARDGKLKKWASTPFKLGLKQITAVGLEAREDYYRLAGHFLHEHEFQTPLDKTIWEAHATGGSLNDIVKLLKSKRKNMARTQVKEAIHRLRSLMSKKYLGGDNDSDT